MHLFVWLFYLYELLMDIKTKIVYYYSSTIFSNMERLPGYGQQYSSEQCIYCEFQVMGPEFA